MIRFKRVGIILLAGIIVLCGLELGARHSIPGLSGFIPSAEARGRAATDPGERGRSGAAYVAALQSGCV